MRKTEEEERKEEEEASSETSAPQWEKDYPLVTIDHLTMFDEYLEMGETVAISLPLRCDQWRF